MSSFSRICSFERAVSDLNPAPQSRITSKVLPTPTSLSTPATTPHVEVPLGHPSGLEVFRWFLYRNPEALKQSGRPWLYEPRLSARKLPFEGP